MQLGILLLYLVVGCSCVCVCHLIWQYRSRRDKPRPWFSPPIIGDIYAFTEDTLHFLADRHSRYGPYSRANLFGKEFILICDPDETIKTVLHAEGREVKGWSSPAQNKLHGGALLGAVGEKHSLMKKEILSLFSSLALRVYFPELRDLTQRHIRRWTAGASSGRLTVAPLLRKLSYAAVAGCLVDMDKADDESELRLYEIWMEGYGGLPFDFPWTAMGKGIKAKNQLKETAAKILREARGSDGDEDGDSVASTTTHSNRLTRKSIADIAWRLKKVGEDTGVDIGDEDVLDNFLILVVAGHETVSSAMASMFKRLSENPAVYEKLVAEVKRISPDGTELTFDQIKSMTYLDGVIKEVLRIDPPVELGLREVIAPLTLGPYSLDKGDTIVIHYASLHKLAFSHPERFDPARWDKDCTEYHEIYSDDKRDALCAFSLGARQCAGRKFALLEMKTFLAVLVKENFRWELAPGQDLTKEQNNNDLRYVLSRSHGIGIWEFPSIFFH